MSKKQIIDKIKINHEKCINNNTRFKGDFLKNRTAKEISIAAREITEIMKYAPLEIRLKYPLKFRSFFRSALNDNYKWKYDTSKKLYEQDVSELTRKILVYLNQNYFNKGGN